MSAHASSMPLAKTRIGYRGDAVATLRMSDYWFLAGLILALVFVADPFQLKLDKVGLTKHLPLMLCLLGVMLTNIGHWLFHPAGAPRPPAWQVLRTGWPLLLLGLWIVAGSVYARKFEDINNTFVTVGIYMLFGIMVARLILLSPARDVILRRYLLTGAIVAIGMLLHMLVRFGDKDVSYHELEALIIPLAVYFAIRPAGHRGGASQHWHAFLTLLFLAGGIIMQKNTAFMVLGITLLYLWITQWRFRFRDDVAFRFWTLFWLILIVIAGLFAAGYLAHQRGELLPTGNPQYRMKTYEVAIGRFYDSPLWGTSFTAPATEKFTAYAIHSARGILATHSDILDLAAQGGILALLLWSWGMLRIGRFCWRHALRAPPPRSDMQAASHALACMSLASIVVYAFNPILLQPVKALLLWSQLGMLLGVAIFLAQAASLSETLKAAAHVPSTALQD